MMLPCSRIEDARPGRGEDRIAEIRLPGRSAFVAVDGAGGGSVASPWGGGRTLADYLDVDSKISSPASVPLILVGITADRLLYDAASCPSSSVSAWP